MIKNPIFTRVRNSKMDLENTYFWTDTVKDWKCLFDNDLYKQLIITTLAELVDKKLIKVYGFVIMPNHLHLIWEMISKNGKEMPSASFNKATGHLIIKDLKAYHKVQLLDFKVTEKEREYRVWQRDPLAILMNTEGKLVQKLNYIHNNPLQEKWSLANRPENYYWSSAKYYETGIDDFGFISHYKERF